MLPFYSYPFYCIWPTWREYLFGLLGLMTLLVKTRSPPINVHRLSTAPEFIHRRLCYSIKDQAIDFTRMLPVPSKYHLPECLAFRLVHPPSNCHSSLTITWFMDGTRSSFNLLYTAAVPPNHGAREAAAHASTSR